MVIPALFSVNQFPAPKNKEKLVVLKSKMEGEYRNLRFLGKIQLFSDTKIGKLFFTNGFPST
jgi:hypothetical protein|nr:MAG TPA: hypothetical protein [Herelleviridae sp.]